MIVDSHFVASSDHHKVYITVDSNINCVDLSKELLAIDCPLLRLAYKAVCDFKVTVAELSEVHDDHPAIDGAEDSHAALGLHLTAVELRKPLDVHLLVVLSLREVQVGQPAEVHESNGGLDGADEEVGVVEAAGGGLEGQLELCLEDGIAVDLPELDEGVEAQGHQHAHLPDPEESADGGGVVAESDHLGFLILNCRYIPGS